MTQPPGDPTLPAHPAQPPAEPPTQAAWPPQPPQPQPPQAPLPPQPPQVYLPQQPPYPPSQGYPQPYIPPPPEAPQPYPWYQQPQPPPKKRRGLLVAILSVVFVLFLAGGGVSVYLLTRDNTKGQATPQAAADGFLTAVYTNHDATAAGRYVCPQARDGGKLTAKINEIKQRDSQYELPKYTWSTPVVKNDASTGQDETHLSITLTLRTANEQKAEQSLLITATRHNGWWVCEVKQGG
jgi:flagellar basal body-associated protein FliL